MPKKGEEDRQKREEQFIKQIHTRRMRRQSGEENRRSSVFFGLGMIGMVGWSVTIPTLIGIAIGVWMDRTWPGAHSWTLTMLFAGVIVGCINAWYWVKNALKRTGKGQG